VHCVVPLVLVDCLIGLDLDETASTKITRLADHLALVLASNTTDLQVLRLASNALGKLVRFGGTVAAEIFDREVRKSMEWLQSEERQTRRLAAVLVLRILAVNAPPLFYVHVVRFTDCIWFALQDSRQQAREGAADALRAALELIGERPSRQRNQWYDKLWQRSLLVCTINIVQQQPEQQPEQQ
jgi:serine/threonine-protein kinase mTOR